MPIGLWQQYSTDDSIYCTVYLTAPFHLELGFQRLVEICNGHSPTPSETEEVKFLFALAAQLRKHPHLVYVYLTQVSYKFYSFFKNKSLETSYRC